LPVLVLGKNLRKGKGEGWIRMLVDCDFFLLLNLIFTIGFEISFFWKDKDSLKFGELED
jgi:hypothetical protein